MRLHFVLLFVVQYQWYYFSVDQFLQIPVHGRNQCYCFCHFIKDWSWIIIFVESMFHSIAIICIKFSTSVVLMFSIIMLYREFSTVSYISLSCLLVLIFVSYTYRNLNFCVLSIHFDRYYLLLSINLGPLVFLNLQWQCCCFICSLDFHFDFTRAHISILCSQNTQYICALFTVSSVPWGKGLNLMCFQIQDPYGENNLSNLILCLKKTPLHSDLTSNNSNQSNTASPCFSSQYQQVFKY